MSSTVISVKSRVLDEWIDITSEAKKLVEGSKVANGVLTVFVPHTTAGVTIQENADPPLKMDITRALERLFPRSETYGHCEHNAVSHMKAVFVGASVQVPFQNRELALGTWQGIYFCEFDGPRERQAVLHLSV